MERVIEVRVRDRRASTISEEMYVCGNGDYTVKFDFDEEWNQHASKTARFINDDGGYYDVVFTGDSCAFPVLSDTWSVKIGVYAGYLHTTTAAHVDANKSILCGSGLPIAPPDDVYAQIMGALDDLRTEFTTDETLTLNRTTMVLSVNTADEPEADNTLPITSGAVAKTLGNINALLETI